MIYLFIGFVISVLGFQIGLHFTDIDSKITALLERDPDPIPGVATALPPNEANVNNQSAIVTPITPRQIEFNEQERIRKL